MFQVMGTSYIFKSKTSIRILTHTKEETAICAALSAAAQHEHIHTTSLLNVSMIATNVRHFQSWYYKANVLPNKQTSRTGSYLEPFQINVNKLYPTKL